MIARFAACCLVVALTYVFASAQSIAPEVADWYGLTENGGFERGDEQPEFWRRFPPRDEDWGRCRRDTSDAHSGQASGLLISEADSPPGKAPVQWNYYHLPVEGGISLLAEYWVKSEGTFAGRLGTHFYDADGNHLGFESINAGGEGGEWVHMRGLLPVPAGAAKLGIALYGSNNQRIRYDDVTLLGTPSADAVRATPIIDGRLDEDCWTPEQAVDRFVLHTGERLPSSRPRAWVACDDTALYFAFECPHPPGAQLKLDATEHDGDVWLDDSVEIFLDPWHEHGDYYQICVNAAGVLRDTHRKDTAWESGAQVAVQRDEDRWTAEVAVPFEALALDFRSGERWGVNFVRNDRVLGETSTWSLGGFHDASRFGTVGVTADFSRYWLADIQRQLPALRERARRLAADIGGVDHMGDDARAEVEGAIEAATDTIETLAQLRPEDELPDDLRERFTSIAARLQDARRSALQALMRGDEEGFGVALAGPLHKIRRDGEETEGLLADRIELTAARDEAESFQIVVVAGEEPLDAVAVQAPPLSGPGGEISLTWRIVDYLETADPGYAAEYVGWWPDPLLPAGAFEVAAGERQPLWFTVEVPPDAEPGDYSTEVTIRHGEREVSVPVTLRVRSFTLPRPGTLATAFGLYASALSRWWWGTEPYRDNMPVEVFRNWCEFMGRYRLTPKNIAREYISVQGGEEYSVDLSALQETVAPLADRYFAPYSFCLHRLPSGPSMAKSAQGTDPAVAAAVTRAFADEWERQGLPREVYIYGYDEPKLDQYPALIANYTAIKEAVPDYPIMQTIGDPEPEELVGLVDIWCPLSPRVLGDFYQQRREAGDTLWMYTCCSPKPPHANFFVDEPAIDHRILFWQVRQAGATGFLYWAVCYWHGLPMPSTDEPHFPDVPLRFERLGTYNNFKDNGDGVLIWPGHDYQPLASIRLECIRDGIEDYEYLTLLSGLIERAEALPEAQRPDETLLAQARELASVPPAISEDMTHFTKDPRVLLERREAVGDMIERLQEALGE